MAVLINKTQSNFTMISNNILHDKELGMKDRGVLCTICSLPDGWEFSIEGLSSIVPDGKDSIRASIQKLEKLGYIVRTMTRKKNGTYNTEIEVFTERKNIDDPSRVIRHGKSATVNPSRKNRDGTAATDNPTQYKTEDIKNNININNIKPISQSEADPQSDGMNDEKSYKKIIANNIKLKWLVETATKHSEAEVSMVYEIYDVICDMVCFPREQVKIKDTLYPWETVKSRFLKLRYEHIATILNRIVDSSLGIKNMHSYLISALYTTSLVENLEIQASLHDDYLMFLRGNPYTI